LQLQEADGALCGILDVIVFGGNVRNEPPVRGDRRRGDTMDVHHILECEMSFPGAFFLFLNAGLFRILLTFGRHDILSVLLRCKEGDVEYIIIYP